MSRWSGKNIDEVRRSEKRPFLRHEDRFEIIVAEQEVNGQYTFVASNYSGLVHLSQDGLPICAATKDKNSVVESGPPKEAKGFCRQCSNRWYMGRRK